MIASDTHTGGTGVSTTPDLRRLAQGTPKPITPEQAMAFCQLNHGRWSVPQMQQHLGLGGFPVDELTIRRWAIPAERQRHNASTTDLTREQRLFKRMTDLRDAGRSLMDAARVLR